MVFYNQSPECINKRVLFVFTPHTMTIAIERQVVEQWKVLLLNSTVLLDCDESCKHLVYEVPGNEQPQEMNSPSTSKRR